MTDVRQPIPPGVVSTVRGRWQRPALTFVSRCTLVIAAVAIALTGRVGEEVGAVAVAAIVAAPLLRVAWLAFRWWHERDRRFLITAIALLAIIASGAALTVAGVGR